MSKNKPCPKCQEIGRDKTGDHLFCMKDGKTWACRTDYHPPFFCDASGNPTDDVKEPEDTSSIDVSGFTSMDIRGIRKEHIDRYGIKVECDTLTGDPKAHYYPVTKNRGQDIIAWKVRMLPKDFSKGVVPPVGKQKCDLFGMNSTPFMPDTIVITEGELDAVAAHQMLHRKVRKCLCLSLPFGGNHKALLDNISFLREASELVFCPDQDDVGLGMIDKISLMLPGIKIMRFSEKDACDMLEKGKAAEFEDAFAHSKPYKPSSIVAVSDIQDEALKPVQYGLDYPFLGLTNLTYGLPTKAIIGIGAGPGTGKTSFVKALQTHLIFKHKQPIGILSLEESPSQTLRSLGGIIINKPVHLPDCKYDAKKLQDAIQSLDGLVQIYDHQGYKDWDDITNTMTYMAHSGVKYIFIDPLSALTAHLSASDANTYLNNAMYILSKLTQSLDITVFHVNHLNNPSTGKDHGAGGKVYGSQFTGSRAMWKFSTDMWGLERDQLSEDINERNKMKVVILKNRLSGVTGSVMLKYDSKQGTLVEIGASSLGGFTNANAKKEDYKLKKADADSDFGF
jgi:twinkle protein